MYSENDNSNGNVTVYLDDEHYERFIDALCDVFNSFSDPMEFVNEGFEIYLGNAYAQYEFTALVDGFVYTYCFGPNEYDELKANRQVTLEPLSWNELSDMPEWIRPEWAA